MHLCTLKYKYLKGMASEYLTRCCTPIPSVDGHLKCFHSYRDYWSDILPLELCFITRSTWHNQYKCPNNNNKIQQFMNVIEWELKQKTLTIM